MKQKKTGAQATEKPRLTGASATLLFKTVLNREQPDSRAKKLKKDWKAFFESEFHLSEMQRTHLQDISAEEGEKIRRGFSEAADKGGDVRLTLASDARGRRSAGEPGGSLTISSSAASPSATARRFKVPLLHCTFDANCRNWKCKLGPEIPPLR